jgi:hypothetical protein
MRERTYFDLGRSDRCSSRLRVGLCPTFSMWECSQTPNLDANDNPYVSRAADSRPEQVAHPTKHPGYTLNADMRTCQGTTFPYGFEFRLPRRAQDCIRSVLDEDPRWIPLLCLSVRWWALSSNDYLSVCKRQSIVSCTCFPS